MTENINDPVTTIYIMEVKVYRKTMLSSHDVMLIPFSKMYTLEEFASGKSWSSIKRENPSYFESEGTTNPESHGKEIITIKISQPERPFIAKKYPIGTPQDPFEKNNTQIDIQERFYHRSYPNQNSASVCGPAAFFTACKWIALIYMRRRHEICGSTEKQKSVRLKSLLVRDVVILRGLFITLMDQKLRVLTG